MCVEGRGLISYVRNYTNCNDCLKLIREIKIPVEELFVKCKFRNREINCKESFVEKIVESNICYTFNSLEVYRHQNSSSVNMEEIDVDWSLDEGYKPTATADVYPYRALGAGQKYGFSFLFKTEQKHLDYGCWLLGGLLVCFFRSQNATLQDDCNPSSIHSSILM
jgi:Amiloride-sensitive sodium channel